MSDVSARQRLSVLSDDELVERVRAGSSVAVEALFERYELPLLAFCRHMLGRRDRGEEAVREAFAEALGTVRMHDRPVHLTALLFRVARNRCLAIVDAGEEDDLEGLDASATGNPWLRELAGAVRALVPEQRAALLLVMLGEHSEEEIATIVGTPRDKLVALVAAARLAVAGEERPADWHCAQTQLELAGHDGEPRREASRRHVEDCTACRHFRATLGQQRRGLAAILPVEPSERLHVPEPAAAPPRPHVRPAVAAEPAKRGPDRARPALAASAVALVVAAVIAMGSGHRAAPSPAAIAPSGAPSGASGQDATSGAGGGPHGGLAGRVQLPVTQTGAGILSRAAGTARDLLAG